MASSGDPSTFTFTMDAFPDYTRFDKSKKVLAAIQIIKSIASQDAYRTQTKHDPLHDLRFM
jgi:Txe/YoeB family toxin of Txe-Axe toxin-antitoxin module